MTTEREITDEAIIAFAQDEGFYFEDDYQKYNWCKLIRQYLAKAIPDGYILCKSEPVAWKLTECSGDIENCTSLLVEATEGDLAPIGEYTVEVQPLYAAAKEKE